MEKIMSIRNIVKDIRNKKLANAKESIHNELYKRTYVAIETMKPEVMQNMVKESLDISEASDYVISVSDKKDRQKLVNILKKRKVPFSQTINKQIHFPSWDNFEEAMEVALRNGIDVVVVEGAEYDDDVLDEAIDSLIEQGYDIDDIDEGLISGAIKGAAVAGAGAVKVAKSGAKKLGDKLKSAKERRKKKKDDKKDK